MLNYNTNNLILLSNGNTLSGVIHSFWGECQGKREEQAELVSLLVGLVSVREFSQEFLDFVDHVG
ncbi:hypothetical protein H744_2c3393 [Photobacterium gaetbulicola Gung47]|uniref:Uncharacterized protein n=1 Tax=Photobacterium gaetbulicola Gung47 TaxID=658445 RepID=A0A0C5WYE3_9GAMM|nr:hypothetical protein H744_2c3393 [Photobacterium gaetbulicola Gung47]